jgi:hypothetical protein
MKTITCNEFIPIVKNHDGAVSVTHFFHLSILLTAILLFSSCKDNASILNDWENIIDIGQFNAEVTGNENQSFSGLALFTVQIIEEPVGNIFVLSMNSLNTSLIYGVGATMQSSGRPAVGTYTLEGVTDGQSAQFTVFNDSTNELTVYQSTSGELKIVSSTQGSLEGEITFKAQIAGGSEEVDVVAQFNASCQEASFLTCD